MQLPNGGVGRLVKQHVLVAVPARRVGLAQVADHGAPAVDAGRHGINVLCLSGLGGAGLGMGGFDGVGVIGVDDVALDGRSPNTCLFFAVHQRFHRNGAELGGACLAVGAGGVAVQCYLCCGRRPNLKDGFFGRIGRAEVVAGIGVLRVERFNSLHIGVGCCTGGVAACGGCTGDDACGRKHTDRKNRRNDFLGCSHKYSSFNNV